MRVIKRGRLEEFWSGAGHGDSKSALLAWYQITTDAVWRSFAEVKATFRTADLFGDCVIFNIGGNKYRLIARIRYESRVYVRHVLTHSEYDRGRWKADCGPPPMTARRFTPR